MQKYSQFAFSISIFSRLERCRFPAWKPASTVGQVYECIERAGDGIFIRATGLSIVTVINAVVLVIADNIHAVIARIPLRRSRVVIAVVFPNQIVNTVFFRQGRIQLLPELLVNFCTALAPPEPRSRTIGIGVALCFVIRTENNRYACILYLFSSSAKVLMVSMTYSYSFVPSTIALEVSKSVSAGL